MQGAVPAAGLLARRTIRRLRTRLLRRVRSGAQPGLSDPVRIAELTALLAVPLNILYAPTGPTLAELTGLGVRRVSLGSLLYRRALAAAVDPATAARDGRPTDLSAPSYAQMQRLAMRDGTTPGGAGPGLPTWTAPDPLGPAD